MTREEAIRILTTKRGMPSTDYNYAEALSLAIEALEQKIKTDNRVKNELNRVKTELEPCEDYISRKAVLNIIDSYSNSQSNVEDVTQDCISDVIALPSVQPKPEPIFYPQVDGITPTVINKKSKE